MSFLGNRSLRRSSRYDPRPEPVPPAMECITIKPWNRPKSSSVELLELNGPGTSVPQGNHYPPPPVQSYPSLLRMSVLRHCSLAPNCYQRHRLLRTRRCFPGCTGSCIRTSRSLE